MSPPSSPSPFAKAVAATARKLSTDSFKTGREADEDETNQAKRHPLWKNALLKQHLTPSNRSPGESFASSERGPTPFGSFYSVKPRNPRNSFFSGFFAAKKLKRFPMDSPSSPSRQNLGLGTFANKKPKWFPLDSPSSRRHETQAIADTEVIDICSSDDDDDDSIESFRDCHSPPLKDPPLYTEEATDTVATGKSTASETQSPRKNIPPPVDLYASSDDDDDDEESLDEAGEECQGNEQNDPQARKDPPPENNKTTNMPRRGNTRPMGSASAKHSTAYRAILMSVATSPETTMAVPNEECSDYEWDVTDRTDDTVCDPSEFASRRRTGHFSVFKGYSLLNTFTIERKRLLLDVLAPESMSLEALNAENWANASYKDVVCAFSERFGKLRDMDLDLLSKGDFLVGGELSVPEGMVSVKKTIAAYRLSLKQASMSPIEDTPIEAITDKTADRGEENIGTEQSQTTNGNEAMAMMQAAESLQLLVENAQAITSHAPEQNEATSRAARGCDMVIELLEETNENSPTETVVQPQYVSKELGEETSKEATEQAIENEKSLQMVNADATESTVEETTAKKVTEEGEEVTENEESQATAAGVDAGVIGGYSSASGFPRRSSFSWDGTLAFISRDPAVGERETSKTDDDCHGGNEESGINEESEAIDEGSEGSDDCEDSEEETGAETASSDEADSVAEDVVVEYQGDESSVACDGGNEESGINEESEAIDEGSEGSEDSKEETGAETASSDEADSVTEDVVVEYQGDESSVEKPEGYLVTLQEARAILSEVVSNIVDTVITQLRPEQEQPLQEIDSDILQGDNELNEQLRLEGSSEAGTSSTRCDEEEKQEEKNHALIVVSAKQLLLLALPLMCLSIVVRRLGLFDVSNSLFEGCFRTFLQLHILGSLLSPIFKYGSKYPGVVGCYALFMVVLASYEASSRTKYTHDHQFPIIVQSLVLNVGWVAMWSFGAILKPRPVWNPRYLLPIVGMLLGNSINGISITLDTLTTSLVEKQSEVDLYLSFGANQYEAVSGIVAHAIQKGTTPFLNMMCVVGIVSIPGMMTGQILGGSSPMVAARYQAMIIFLIAMATLSTILLSSCFTVMSAFCSHQILRPDKFIKNRKRGLARLILWVWGYIFGGGSDMAPIGTNGMAGRNGVGLIAEEEINTTLRPPVTGFEIRPLKKGSVVSDGEGRNSLFQASGLERYFEDEDAAPKTSSRRVLFEDLSFRVNEGDLLLVSGPSGTGKSQLLRMMAGLSPLQDGTLLLEGETWNDDYDGIHAVEWRRHVRYVTQNKVEIPGTPLQFIKKIQSFQSWSDGGLTGYDVMKHVSHHIRQWGMGLECLEKEWSVLSGGESQRVLMAIALASRPKILLFDESTSALDHESKLAVETSIKDFVEDHEGGVVWVSHDAHQAERMMDDSESNGVYAF